MDELIKLQRDDIWAAYPDKPPFLTMQQVEKYLHRRRESLLKDKTFPVRHVGRVWQVNVLALAKWMLKK